MDISQHPIFCTDRVDFENLVFCVQFECQLVVENCTVRPISGWQI